MDIIKFIQQAIKLKEIKRTGWLYKDVPNPESVADHSFGVAMLALTVPLPKGINREKLVKMALIEELGEIETGDIVWEKGLHINLKKQKEQRNSEKKTVNKIFDIIDNEKLKNLLLEYLEQKTKTAKFLKELDKLEMVLQALEYEKRIHPSKLNEFWINADKYIKDKGLREYFLELKKQRKSD